MSDTEQARSNEGDITEQIFDRFKTYLDQKVETLTNDLTSQTNHQSKHLERQSEGRQLKFEGNKDQFLFNAELQEHIEISSGLLKQADISGALEKLTTAQRSIHNRQKKIKLADKSEAGWLAVKEYEAEDLASNSEDEKRIKKAQASALRKKSKQRQTKIFQQEYKSDSRTRGAVSRDNQFLRGNLCVHSHRCTMPKFWLSAHKPFL